MIIYEILNEDPNYAEWLQKNKWAFSWKSFEGERWTEEEWTNIEENTLSIIHSRKCAEKI